MSGLFTKEKQTYDTKQFSISAFFGDGDCVIKNLKSNDSQFCLAKKFSLEAKETGVFNFFLHDVEGGFKIWNQKDDSPIPIHGNLFVMKLKQGERFTFFGESTKKDILGICISYVCKTAY